MKLDFSKWSSMMIETYGDNGKFAVLYAIMCAFRDDIHRSVGHFTALFIHGETESGKSELSSSIGALFACRNELVYDISSISDALFFTMLQDNINCPVIFEEYPDDYITEAKFNELKNAVYDGSGKQYVYRGKHYQSSVNAPLIILSKQQSIRDNSALMHRSIPISLHRLKAYLHPLSIHSFNALKQAESEGLFHILDQIKVNRSVIINHFAEEYLNCNRDLRQLLTENKIPLNERSIRAHTLMLTVCKLWEMYVPYQKLHFTYDEMLTMIATKIAKYPQA